MADGTGAMGAVPALRLYLGQTRHSRFKPFEQSFAYKLFLIDLDIDRLDEAGGLCRLFSVEKPNLFSFRRKDHGDRTGSGLRPWAEAKFAEAGVDLSGGSVRLVTLPRHAFYKFSPISLWYGYGQGGDLRGIIYEVNNTFGDTHSYVARANDGLMRHTAEKHLHVSPFFDVSGAYRFTARPPGKHLDLVVDNIDAGERIHMANIKAQLQPASDGALLKAAVTRPFSSHGVTAGIHWEALKIWLKGAGYRSRPAPHPAAATHAAPILENKTKIV
ncbi:MAG: DUF1365 domain-containing protein [Pseudomonadota bacterium]